MENQNSNTCCGEREKKCDCKMCKMWGWCPAGKWHKIIGIIVLIFVVIFIGRAICGDHGDWKDSNLQKDTITVSGKGELSITPDIAKVSFSVLVENKNVGPAQTEAATKMNNIIDSLKTSGVDKKDIKTTNYSIYPRYDYVQTSQTYPYSGKQILAGYVVNQTVEVTIRKIADAGDILAEVGKLGVTDISNLSFLSDKEDAFKLDARELAIQDARAQAKRLAKNLDVRLVKITAFSESGNYPIYYDRMSLSSKAAGAESSVAPQIPVGENKITSNVSITYEIR
jgi:uncharacterized protein YggE